MALMDVKGYAAALFLFMTTCVFLFLLGDPQAFYANSHGDRKLKEEALHFMTEETAGRAEPQYTTSSSSAIYMNLNREPEYYMQGDGNLEVVTRNALQQDENGDEERVFEVHGSVAALFVLYGAYHGGSNTFAAVGLGYKPLYLYGEPKFECYWIPSMSNLTAPIYDEPIKS